MPSEWNMFVKKIYEEGKAKDSDYQFKQALKDASKRKSEMGDSNVKSMKKSRSTSRRSKKSSSRGRRVSSSASMAGGKKSRRRRRN